MSRPKKVDCHGPSWEGWKVYHDRRWILGKCIPIETSRRSNSRPVAFLAAKDPIEWLEQFLGHCNGCKAPISGPFDFGNGRRSTVFKGIGHPVLLSPTLAGGCDWHTCFRLLCRWLEVPLGSLQSTRRLTAFRFYASLKKLKIVSSSLFPQRYQHHAMDATMINKATSIQHKTIVQGFEASAQCMLKCCPRKAYVDHRDCVLRLAVPRATFCRGSRDRADRVMICPSP